MLVIKENLSKFTRLNPDNMKKVLLSMLAIIAVASVAVAQEKSSQKQYLTGPKFVDHTFVGASAGINTLLSRDNGFDKKSKLTFDLDIYAGKWFTPSVGARVGFQKMNVREQFIADFYSHTILSNPDPEGHNKYGANYIHADFLWDVFNAFGGYKDRVVSLIPYAHVGWVRLYDPEMGVSSEYRDDEMAFGPAVMATFKVAKRFAIVLDVKDVMFSGRFHDYGDAGVVNNITASAGLVYKLGKTDWDRCSQTPAPQVVDRSSELAEAMAALVAAQAALDQANRDKADLQKKLDELQNRPVEKDVVYIKTNLGVAPLTLFYEINSAELNQTELRHLDDYITAILEQDPDRTFYLTGSADRGTGSFEHNSILANKRANYVRDVLINKYMVRDSNIVVNEGLVTDSNSDPRLDRSVVVRH